MIKKVLFTVSVIVNIILAIVFVITAAGAAAELKFEYVESDTIQPDSLRMYLDMENYGTAASLSHPIRGGAEIAPEYEDYYRLGEYTDLLFLKEMFKEAGNTETYEQCEADLGKIRDKMPEYTAIFDKMDTSVEAAVRE